MWSRKELKTNAKAALKNFWGKAILSMLIVVAVAVAGVLVYSIVVGVVMALTGDVTTTGNSVQATTTDPVGTLVMFVAYIILVVFILFVLTPMEVGLARFFMKSRAVPTPVGEVFSLIKKGPHIAGVSILMSIKIFLWSLLFVIPGIIKTYEYSMISYILAENPDMPTKRVFQVSRALTKGNKWHLFVLGLSFILWNMLASIIPPVYLYLAPYMQATMVEAYYKLKADAVMRGDVTLAELPDAATQANV